MNFDTKDTTSEFDSTDIAQNKTMAILAYLGILVLIPILAAKNSKYARYHANQGLLLFIAEIALSIVLRILVTISAVFGIFGLLDFALLALLIIGIINVSNGKEKELPIIGGYILLK